MLNKIILDENGNFKIEEIIVYDDKNKDGGESGVWKTSNGNMKVCAFDKVNYEAKTNTFFLNTTQEVEFMKLNLIYEAITMLQGFSMGYKLKNKIDRANIYKRTKSLKRIMKSLVLLERLKKRNDNSM